MRFGSSLSRRSVLLIVIISPALLGSEFRCVAVSNPTVATVRAAARIDQIEPRMPRVGEIVRFTGSGNGTPPLQFSWDFGDGAQAVGFQAAHAYTAPGSYRLTLSVRDATGGTASDSSQVAVSALLPSSALSLVLVSKAVAGQPVLLAALPLDGNAHARSYVWTFSDGQSATGPWATATFPVAGGYSVSVTVTDDRGAITVAQIAFPVVDAAQ